MHKNLNAEMVRFGVSLDDIRVVIGKTGRTARDKVKGRVAFTLPEAVRIRDKYFPGMSLEYLFAESIDDHRAS